MFQISTEAAVTIFVAVVGQLGLLIKLWKDKNKSEAELRAKGLQREIDQDAAQSTIIMELIRVIRSLDNSINESAASNKELAEAQRDMYGTLKTLVNSNKEDRALFQKYLVDMSEKVARIHNRVISEGNSPQ